MNVVMILLALSASTGFAVRSFSWMAIGIAGFLLAIVSSVALHLQGFSALPGIAIIVTCLTVNQAAYLIGLLTNQPSDGGVQQRAGAKPSWNARYSLMYGSSQQETDETPRDSRDDDVRR
jgi:hypothetical protein